MGFFTKSKCPSAYLGKGTSKPKPYINKGIISSTLYPEPTPEIVNETPVINKPMETEASEQVVLPMEEEDLIKRDHALLTTKPKPLVSCLKKVKLNSLLV